ncbi:MAG TPA: hypothetical protein PLK79_08460, partial [Thermoleophilia bacterium]|nr:hypothetical protein [Thermoleophilia bacterium]
MAVPAGRCLRIPPKGEQQAADEGEVAVEKSEVAGAYLNVALPTGLVCRIVTHRAAILRARPVWAQGE